MTGEFPAQRSSYAENISIWWRHHDGKKYAQINQQYYARLPDDDLGPFPIRSSDNDSTGFWPPGSLHTLGADGHI